MTVGYGPGGGYDVYARVLARHMGAHVPGEPNIVVQNMPGAASLKSVQWLDQGAPTRLATNISGYCAEPDWSDANPNKIVFTAKMGGGYQTAVFDMAARASKIVTKAPTDALEPVWMADGRHIICTYRAANTRSLWLVDTESGRATRLSPTSLGNASGAAYLTP